jgi:hypothetical protein
MGRARLIRAFETDPRGRRRGGVPKARIRGEVAAGVREARLPRKPRWEPLSAP